MKNILIDLYTSAIELARMKQQMIGEKNDYYITLEQLERLIKTWTEFNSTT